MNLEDREKMTNFRTNMDRLGSRPGPQIRIFSDPYDEGDTPYEDRDTVMVCEICGTILNRFSGPEEEETYVHGKAWQSYDHEPIAKAVSKEQHQGGMCDFCGLEDGNVWAFEGERVQAETGNTVHDYGRTWGACQPCADLILDSDFEGLLDRVIRVSPIAKGSDDKPRIREAISELLLPFLASVHSKAWIGPKREPAKLDPRMMPKLHAGVKKFWSHPELYDRLAKKDFLGMSLPGEHAGHPEVFRHYYAPGVHMPKENFERHARHVLVGLDVAELYWISADFTQLALMASHDFDTIMVSREQLPAPFGFLVWDSPIGEIQRPGGMAGVRGISWTLVPHGVWFNVYIQGEDADPEIDVVQMRAESGYLYTPNVGAGVAFDVDLGPTGTAYGQAENIVLAVLSTWFLLLQPGVAEVTTAPVDKKLARSMHRAGQKVPAVQLVDLRRRPRRTEPPDHREGRAYTHRRFIKGHWKRQQYGPKNGLRKTIYISPYVSGAESLPLRADKPPVVKVLR